MSKARLVITAIETEGITQAEAARRYGVSKGWVSKLMARRRAEGDAAYEPKSRRPATSPHATPETVVDLVLALRKQLTEAGLDKEIWQCPVVLLADVRSVGVQGDGRTYGHPVVLRPVSSEDAMTADWTRVPYDVLAQISTRITNEVPEINRVVLDVTSKPPGTIEWE